jgi:hypothetical protein
MIENEYRYEQATKARIARNREIGRAKRAGAKREAYLAQPGKPELIASLQAAAAAERNYGFMSKLFDSYQDWGSLTDNQEAAVVRILAQRKEQDAARAAENAVKADQSNFVGEIGVRGQFELVVVRNWVFNSQRRHSYYDSGERFGYELADAEGNVFIYIGSQLKGPLSYAEKGDRLVLKAGIKDHNVRDGIRQNLLNRPKVVDLIPARPPEANDDLSADIQAAEAANHGY